MEKIAYSVPETVHVSGIGRTTLFELIRDGEIASVKVGRRRLILADSLRAYLKKLEEAQQQESAAAGARAS